MIIYSILKTFKNGDVEKVYLLKTDNDNDFSNSAILGSKTNNDDIVFFKNVYIALNALSDDVDNGILKSFKILKKYTFSDE